MSYQQRELFPEASDAPDFSDVEHSLEGIDGKKETGPRTLNAALSGMMTSIDIRILVNGTSESVRNNALKALVEKGVSTEYIEMTLNNLSKRSPKHFPLEKVKQTLKWVESEWYNIHGQQRSNDPHKPR